MDPHFSALLPCLKRGGCRSAQWQNEYLPKLLVADENLDQADFSQLAKNTEVITNRFDIAKAAAAEGLKSHFNDYDFSVFPHSYFAQICCRIPKEAVLARHIIDQALFYLKLNGQLILCGAKNEGIRRFAQYAGKTSGTAVGVKKLGTTYLASITKTMPLCKPTHNDSENSYCRFIAVSVDNSTTLYSKPGVFGAGKIDQGSLFLTSHLNSFCEDLPPAQSSLLDLGCGYGYLALFGARQGFSRIIATDNCAAAINICKTNFERLELPGEVIADDCAATIEETFDVVVCNPPFHRGFKTDPALTKKFVDSAARLLKRGGKALFVVNRFVPLAKTAKSAFKDVTLIDQNNGYKLFLLENGG
jgi:16S rRNA (guanine1207-N2)-methyltransferase